jgi:hypothetical protein
MTHADDVLQFVTEWNEAFITPDPEPVWRALAARTRARPGGETVLAAALAVLHEERVIDAHGRRIEAESIVSQLDYLVTFLPDELDALDESAHAKYAMRAFYAARASSAERVLADDGWRPEVDFEVVAVGDRKRDERRFRRRNRMRDLRRRYFRFLRAFR